MSYVSLQPRGLYQLLIRLSIPHFVSSSKPIIQDDWLIDGNCIAWDEASEKAKSFVSQLTMSEKIGLVTGSYGRAPFLSYVGTLAPVERLNYTGLCMLDGSNGVNRADGVSVFASGITVAATSHV